MTTNKPIKTYKVGVLSLSMWENELKEGKHDGKPKTLHNIFHSKNLGITFYEQA